MSFAFLRFAVKAGLASGTIYYTVDEGVWGNSTRSVELYGRIKKAAQPYLKEIPLEVELPDLPSFEGLANQSKLFWNRGVVATFGFLVELPDKVIEWGSAAYKMTTEQTSSKPAEIK